MNPSSEDRPQVQAMTREQHIESICKSAILYTLSRVTASPRVREIIGPGTETYVRLTNAAALLLNEPVDTVRERTILGSAALHRHD